MKRPCHGAASPVPDDDMVQKRNPAAAECPCKVPCKLPVTERRLRAAAWMAVHQYDPVAAA